MCPRCMESNLLGSGNYEFVHRVGYENCIKIFLPTVCRSCKKSINIETLEVRSRNPRNVFNKV
jgi:hypothetical protein